MSSEVWNQLIHGKPLGDLDVAKVNGRFDLRNLRIPEPYDVETIRTPIANVTVLGGLTSIEGERAGLEKFRPRISAGLPKYVPNGPTYGLLITNVGKVILIKSGDADPLYENYDAAGHVEGKAAVLIRKDGSTGGVLYHNNTDGICWTCQSQIKTLLPEGAVLKVFPPPDAIAKSPWWMEGPKEYKGNAGLPLPPKPPPPDPQYDLFEEPQE
jgi:hypothetical protein